MSDTKLGRRGEHGGSCGQVETAGVAAVLQSVHGAAVSRKYSPSSSAKVSRVLFA